MTTSLVDDLARAHAAVWGVIARIRPDQCTMPTPCTEWNVREVINHLVGMNHVFVAMLDEAPMPQRRDDHLGDDPIGAYQRSADALQTAAARPGVLVKSSTTRLGTATGAERMRWRIADLLTHAWDLTQVIGGPLDLPEDLVEQSLAFVMAQLPNQARTGRFADPQPVADTAAAIDRLAAFTGRTVAPAAGTRT